jgi:hypothetical protein
LNLNVDISKLLSTYLAHSMYVMPRYTKKRRLKRDALTY